MSNGVMKEIGSSGGGGAELDGRTSLRATGIFPLPKLKLDRSPTRDSVPIAGYGIPTGRRRMPPVFRPCPGSGKSGPPPGTLCQQLDMGCRQNAVRHHELARCRGGPARVAPGERDESGGLGAAHAWAAGA